MSLKLNRLENLVLDWKTSLNEQYGKQFLIQFSSQNEIKPFKKNWEQRNGKTASSNFYWQKR